MAGWAQWIRGGLDALQSKHLLRTLRPIVPIGGAHSSPVKVRSANCVLCAGEGLPQILGFPLERR